MGKKALCIKTKDFLENRSLKNKTYELVDRDICETDDSYLQLIPYVVIVNKDTQKVFIYKRGKSGNEDRLHDLYSIGVGGHVEENGPDINEILVNCAVREIEEEIGYKCDLEEIEQIRNQIDIFSLYIYDDSNDVGKHHLGICITFYASEEKLNLLEMEADVIIDTKWHDINELGEKLKDELINLETWSVHAFNHFFAKGKPLLVAL